MSHHALARQAQPTSLQLIRTRAIHRMEMRDYSGWIADVDKARAQAKTLGLTGNPYFDQSLGLSSDVLIAPM